MPILKPQASLTGIAHFCEQRRRVELAIVWNRDNYGIGDFCVANEAEGRSVVEPWDAATVPYKLHAWFFLIVVRHDGDRYPAAGSTFKQASASEKIDERKIVNVLYMVF